MSNKIPIDDLFREKLSGGKEQLNLGAWANMERMLKGQNPYAAEEEPKRKKRIFPFMIVFILLSAAVSAGYLWMNKTENTGSNLTQQNQAPAVNKNENSEGHALAANNNITQNNNTNNEIIHTPNQVNTPNQVGLNEKSRAKKGKHRQNPEHANATQSQNLNSGIAIAQNDAKKPGRNKKPAVSEPGTGEPSEEIPALEHTVNASGEPKKTGKNKSRVNGMVKNTDPATDAPLLASTEKFSTKPRTVKVDQTIAEEKVSRNRNGSISRVYYDTTDKSTFEMERASKDHNAHAVADNIQKGPDYKYHPRYLTANEETGANEELVLNSPMNYAAANAMKGPAQEVKPEGKNKQKKEDKTNVIGTIGAFTGATLAKIGESGNNVLKMFSLFDPGISLGVNAALFNTKHNYGGFHGGLTNHTAISETFGIITELKFFIRNNSGFTINDIRTKVLNPEDDSLSMPGYHVYKYQVDSTTKKYNFKNFMSLELPVMLNARFNNLSVYGGPNFVYNMKLKINEIDRNYAVNKEEIVPNGVSFKYPYDKEKSMQYTRQDFGARFGIGYAVGVSYNFNPNIYLDLRMSKVMWDNTKTNSQREISNGVTKVPFTQLSLGYRFKNK